MEKELMKLIKKILLVGVIIIAINIVLNAINILQGGLGGWDGRPIEEILGVSAERATVASLERLSKSDVMQVFYAATAPQFAGMKGQYRAKTLSVGVMAFAVNLYTHNFFGPGHWEGKAFFPFEKDTGRGYNLFAVTGKGGKPAIARMRQVDTYVGKSNIDDRDSFHLDYSPYNEGMVNSMHDEIREINGQLYIGMGYMSAGGGSINPAPFVLYGKPDRWVGADKKGLCSWSSR
jgi:hypothetical protein